MQVDLFQEVNRVFGNLPGTRVLFFKTAPYNTAIVILETPETFTVHRVDLNSLRENRLQAPAFASSYVHALDIAENGSL